MDKRKSPILCFVTSSYFPRTKKLFRITAPISELEKLVKYTFSWKEHTTLYFKLSQKVRHSCRPCLRARPNYTSAHLKENLKRFPSILSLWEYYHNLRTDKLQPGVLFSPRQPRQSTLIVNFSTGNLWFILSTSDRYPIVFKIVQTFNAKLTIGAASSSEGDDLHRLLSKHLRIKRILYIYI